MNRNALEAIVTDVQKFCVHDGPGLRTTVFFKGCPLRCIWCQNPETQSAAPELMVLDTECVGCGECVRVCPQQAIGPAGTDAARCTLCGACVERCCAKARRIIGRRWGLEELLAYLMQDAVFYRNTGGGVTLSGGEVLTQAAFAAALLERLAAAGVNTAIETCGYAAPQIFETVASRADYILFDVKHADAEKHRHYTGADNAPILENLMRCGALGKHLIVRYPLMPGVNDTPQEAAAIAELARRAGAEDVHILPFHQMGQDKWRQVGKSYRCAHWQTPGKDAILAAQRAVQAFGFETNVWGYGNYKT